MSVKEIQYGNATVKLYRPTLTEEERQRSEANIQRTLQIVGKEFVKKGMNE